MYYTQLCENEADGFLPCCAANGQEEIIQSRGIMEKSVRGKEWEGTGKGRVSKDGGECYVFVKAPFPFVG